MVKHNGSRIEKYTNPDFVENFNTVRWSFTKLAVRSRPEEPLKHFETYNSDIFSQTEGKMIFWMS